VTKWRLNTIYLFNTRRRRNMSGDAATGKERREECHTDLTGSREAGLIKPVYQEAGKQDS
jgi:hypothetical protein